MNLFRDCLRTLVIGLALTTAVALAQAPSLPVAGSGPSPDLAAKQQARIAAYAQQDQTNPPPKKAIVFVGSSIFDQWTTVTEHMAPLPVFNRAISGTITAQQLEYIDQLVLKHQPRVVVYYCGSNDINAGIDAGTIVANVQQYADRLAKNLPDTTLIIASILRAPQKQPLWNVVDDANAKLKALAARNRHVKFVDINPAVVDSQGAPRLELYQDDLLHYKPAAYDGFSQLIKPVVQTVWQQ